MSNGYLTGCALVIAILITVMFFIKKSVENIETQIFKKMLICNILESLATTLIVIIALTINSNMVLEILNRIDVILIITWCSLMFYYIYNISKEENNKKIKTWMIIMNIVMYILSLFLNVQIINSNGILNSTGPLTYLGFFGATFYIALMIVILLTTKIKKQKMDKNKYIPLYFLILLLIVVAILRTVIPEINFISILLSLIDMIMILTIENPDAKMIMNINLAKEQAEKKQITDFYLNNRHLINNWDLVDISAHKILGDYVAQTQDNGILYALADEDNLWAQRIAVVSCWCLIKQDNFADIKNLAVKFLGHKHDLIHKSVGWMLREMGKRNEKELLAFLDSYAASLPRTTLRYALERLPEEVRHYYMRKKQ